MQAKLLLTMRPKIKVSKRSHFSRKATDRAHKWGWGYWKLAKCTSSSPDNYHQRSCTQKPLMKPIFVLSCGAEDWLILRVVGREHGGLDSSRSFRAFPYEALGQTRWPSWKRRSSTSPYADGYPLGKRIHSESMLWNYEPYFGDFRGVSIEAGLV